MDFGIAKTRMAHASLTRAGWLVGTPAYLAPERLEAGAAGYAPSVDIYAMGVVLYRMVSGSLPFREIDFEKLARMIRNENPPPPSSLAPQVPRVLDDLILDLLAKKPEDRPRNCFEVQTRLRALLQGVPGVGDRNLF
jgi:serine/threonine protein kinase